MESTTLTKRLFVGNLSFNVTEGDLQEAFAQWGATEAAIPTSETGRPKGFGFVNVSADQMDAAISAMDGKELAGRAIAGNEARPREPRGPDPQTQGAAAAAKPALPPAPAEKIAPPIREK